MPHGPGLSHDELRSKAVEQIEAGQLPVLTPSERLYAGYGSDEPCNLCGEPIGAKQVAYDVNESSCARNLIFHVVCYSVWQLECSSRLGQERTRRLGYGVVSREQ